MMNWIYRYQLILFDFDGLLVDTEKLHYKAYQRMCAQRGVTLDWGFENYCKIAHYNSLGLSQTLYTRYPKLKAQEPSWDVLYAEKKQAMVALLKEGVVEIMLGVEPLLLELEKAQISRCVVTHSPKELIQVVKQKHPVLNSIPVWITREYYTKPKPDPECYLKAIGELAKPEDRIVGFEDTPRGLHALMGTRAKSVLVCETDYPEISSFQEKGVVHYRSFTEIPESGP